MNAQAQVTADQTQTSQPDRNEIGASFIKRASELKKGDDAGATALVEDAVLDEMPEAFDDLFTKAIAKSTGLKQSPYSKTLRKMRTAPSVSTNPAANAQPTFVNRNPDPEPNPWPLSKVIDYIVRTIQRQIICPPYMVWAIALWTVGTFGFQDCPVFPRLIFTSPTKRCGKSTALATVEALCSNPDRTDGISPAAMFRLIAERKPTLCVDEVDTFFNKNEEYRGIANAGYHYNGKITRMMPTPDGKGWHIADFNVFCPMAFAGIGSMKDTVTDRALTIKLERAAARGSGARRKPLRYRDLEFLRAQIVPHLVAHAPAIRGAMAAGVKVLPAGLNDRAQDNWEPLLALADYVGGVWPRQARSAALALATGDDSLTHRDMLLADLWDIIKEQRRPVARQMWTWLRGGKIGPRPTANPYIRSADAVAELIKIEHRPWPEYGKDSKGMTPNRLAVLLRPLNILPTKQRMSLPQHPGLSFPATASVHVYSVATLRAAYRQYLMS